MAEEDDHLQFQRCVCMQRETRDKEQVERERDYREGERGDVWRAELLRHPQTFSVFNKVVLFQSFYDFSETGSRVE